MTSSDGVETERHGPLAGIRVVELASLGPGPFCGMMLADMGADVIKLDAASMVGVEPPPGPFAIPDEALTLFRGRRSVGVDLKSPAGVALVLDLVREADVLLEGYRPGVMERLGLGPEACLDANPRLVYGRVTGYGQDGPMAGMPGHDLNYIALSGALSMIGTRDRPVMPLSLLGDFGGGGMMFAFGVCAALVEVGRSGTGQVVDAAMVEGVSLLSTLFHGLFAAGHMVPRRESNMVDGGAHFYNVYETRDGKWITIAAAIDKFYRRLLAALDLDVEEFPQMDRARWPELRERLAEIFKTRTRAEWDELLSGPEFCYAPMLEAGEAPRHPQHRARESFVEVAGIVQPAPAPRFSRTPGAVAGPPPGLGAHTRAALAEWGIPARRIEELIGRGVLRQLGE